MGGVKNSNKYKLAVIGDSMAQGFQNGGVYRTDLSFPALLTNCFEPRVSFEKPSFIAQAGIPVNMEVLVRGLSEEYGESITSWREYTSAALYLYKTLRRIKNYWEAGKRNLRIERDTPWHNQAVWGFTASDAWVLTDQLCGELIKRRKTSYSVFNVLPDDAMYLTARMVLNPAFDPELGDRSQVENIRYLHENGGVENLIVCIGHNNFVGAISTLKIIYSTPDELTVPHADRTHTVYRPEHFEAEMRQLFEKVASMNIQRVFVPTYPYITIPPVTRGVNFGKRPHEGGYFDFYTRFWIWDEDFNPEKHPHLTRNQAIELDHLVDQYNAIIGSLADEFGFITVPVHKYVHAVARRRLGVNAVRPYPPEFINALKRNPKTSQLVTPDGKVKLTTDFIRLRDDDHTLMQGGIFSLDGLHPTTIGYGLIANIYRLSMQEAGVTFEKPMDWDYIIRNDTLVTDPPHLLAEFRLLLRFLSLGRDEKFTKMGQSMLQKLLTTFSRQGG